jgi:hypothetical protein
LGDPLKGNLLLFYKPLHLEAQQVSTRIEVRRHHMARYTMRSARNYPCLRREENSGGRTGYSENHWDSFFVSPKYGKRMGLTGFPNSSPRALNLK